MQKGSSMSNNSSLWALFIALQLALVACLVIATVQGFPYVALAILAIQFVSVVFFSIVQGD